MKVYKVYDAKTTLGEHKGSSRLWLQGKVPQAAGFEPGLRFNVRLNADHVVLELAANGEGTNMVSKKTEKGHEVPVIDVLRKELPDIFKGCSALRVVVRDGKISILPLASELRVKERIARLKEKLAANEPLTSGALSFGGGVLDHAVHTGLTEAGVTHKLAFANEIREDLLEHAAEVNDAINPDTQLIVAPMQEFAFDRQAMSHLPKVELMAMGLPCSGASVAGKAKNGNSMAEQHPEVGHLVVAALNIIVQANPVAIVFENVVPYSNTASAAILRNQLRDLGYVTQEREFLGTDFGELEARKRWCMVAMTAGVEFNLDDVAPGLFEVRQLKDILEPLADVADRWSEMTGLKAKQERDIAAGKGFRMQVYTGEETSIATLTKGIAKNRSTDPKIQHPENPNLLRIPTAREHARAKGIPERLIDGLSQTTAHELLGQSIVYAPFKRVAQAVGQALLSLKETVSESMATPAWAARIAG